MSPSSSGSRNNDGESKGSPVMISGGANVSSTDRDTLSFLQKKANKVPPSAEVPRATERKVSDIKTSDLEAASATVASSNATRALSAKTTHGNNNNTTTTASLDILSGPHLDDGAILARGWKKEDTDRFSAASTVVKETSANSYNNTTASTEVQKMRGSLDSSQLLQDRLSQCVDAACRDRERKRNEKKMTVRGAGDEKDKSFAMQGGFIRNEVDDQEDEDEPPPDRMAIGHAAWGVLHSAAATWKQQPGYLEQQRMHEWIHAFAALFPCVQCRAHFQPFLQKEPPWTRGGRDGLSLWACRAHNYVNESLERPLFTCDTSELLKKWTRKQWPEPGDEED